MRKWNGRFVASEKAGEKVLSFLFCFFRFSLFISSFLISSVSQFSTVSSAMRSDQFSRGVFELEMGEVEAAERRALLDSASTEAGVSWRRRSSGLSRKESRGLWMSRGKRCLGGDVNCGGAEKVGTLGGKYGDERRPTSSTSVD